MMQILNKNGAIYRDAKNPSLFGEIVGLEAGPYPQLGRKNLVGTKMFSVNLSIL